VEFARFASGPRLLPALVEGAPPQPAFWTLSRKATVLAAAGDLAVRESVWSHDVGQWSRAEKMRSATGVEAIISDWVEAKGLDGAVGRAAEPNQRMPAQIRAPFQALVERELGWKAAKIPLRQNNDGRAS
jgi:hypothetical protein